VSGPLLIAGANGMLGTALQIVAAESGNVAVAPPEGGFDISSPRTVDDLVGAFAQQHPDGVLINAAAYTNVERAEDEPERAFLVNDEGAANLANAAYHERLRFVHVSTDFVFDGAKAGPYVETDEPHPLSVYGASKLAGERSVVAASPDALIVRTAWVFGPGGVNFPTKILERAASSDTISVVDDEIGSPTYTIDLARGILALLDAGATGIFHLANAGSCARDEMAREILRLAGLDSVTVVPLPAATFPVKAARPANSVLDCSKAAAAGVAMPDWRDALARFIGRS
jgi:dTDP-4-dehydrorhamnose reductase